MTDMSTGEIIIYQTEDGQTKLDVKLERETIWLNLDQMATLFGRDKSVISRHLNNVFKSQELLRKSVVAKNATTASDGKTYMMDYYNLDAIISIGYRVNSKRGTEFRIWATGVLKDHIVKGYTVNEKRLRDENIRLKELQETVDLLGRIIDQRQLVGQEAEGLLKVVADYSQALKLLDDYDYNRLTIGDVTEQPRFAISYEAARSAIDKLASGIDSTLSKVLLELYTRLLKGKKYIRALKKRQLIFSTLWSRTTLLWMATNASRHLSFSGFSMPTGFFTERMEGKGLAIMLLLH